MRSQSAIRAARLSPNSFKIASKSGQSDRTTNQPLVNAQPSPSLHHRFGIQNSEFGTPHHRPHSKFKTQNSKFLLRRRYANKTLHHPITPSPHHSPTPTMGDVRGHRLPHLPASQSPQDIPRAKQRLSDPNLGWHRPATLQAVRFRKARADFLN